MKRQCLGAAVAAVSSVFVATAGAQTQPVLELEIAIDVDSGAVENREAERTVIYSTAVEVPNAAWVRLAFDGNTRLGAAPPGGVPTVVRITSVHDGASQSLNARHLEEWSYTSAYFNGAVLLIDILADPGAAESRIAMSRATFGPINPVGRQSLCGADDRQLSDDRRMGRLWPAGCSGWMIDDANHCLLTAGHCIGGTPLTMHFNVPLSNPNGQINLPAPEDQYAVDAKSIQTNGGKGIGDDWAYFGCFANTETGLTPFEAQGDFFVLADMPPAVSKQDIRITGYGVTGDGIPREWNKAQKTHAGPYVDFTDTTIKYMTDTTGGDSGSPVVDEETGLAIGIHTHGGCLSEGGNHGTASHHKGLRNALANPLGICRPQNPGDVDGDGDADFQDLIELLAAWGPCDDPPAECPADLDGNGSVDVLDLLRVLANWS